MVALPRLVTGVRSSRRLLGLVAFLLAGQACDGEKLWLVRRGCRGGDDCGLGESAAGGQLGEGGDCANGPECGGGTDNATGMAGVVSGVGGRAGSGAGGNSSATPSAGRGDLPSTRGGAGSGAVTGNAGAVAGKGGAAGSSNTAGSSNLAGSGGAPSGPFQCAEVVPACNAVSELPELDQCFGAGEFEGAVGVPFGSGLILEPGRGALHLTGEVSTYSGIQILFTRCSDLSAYTGISFTLSGVVGAAESSANTIEFVLPTNSTFPWQTLENTSRMLGGCTAVDPFNVWATCISPRVTIAVPAPPTVVEVRWEDVIGGAPTIWDARVSPRELMGIQWQFPWSSSFTPYAVDVMVDDIKFIGGAEEVLCAAGGCSADSGGTGGTGGEGGEHMGGVSSELEGGVAGI